MGVKVQYKDLGLIDYKVAWDYQEALFNMAVKAKNTSHKYSEASEKMPKNHLIFCEHPHVFTLGKSGQENNLLIDRDLLRKHNATYYRTNRGGDITYHGPGQIVGYPILDLESFKMGVKDYIFKIEEVVIRTLVDFGITSERLKGATGVWQDTKNPLKARKICAIGVKVSRYITMHGFAFNVNTDLSYYNLINPCGFTDKGISSLEKELGRTIDIGSVKEILKKKFSQVFGVEICE